MICNRCQGTGRMRIANLWPEITENTNVMRCDECQGGLRRPVAEVTDPCEQALSEEPIG